ncbi:peptidoglycan DD-metalloendopeptidase family protein [Ramlibacter sp. G-1-2-2]|uniref:Peptidoglycan DD-metalloendopeptidase family protein n=2 Tax=Ramlibacter agri TaxID=2728837 RepID=A0A848H9D0_9BURK|nr:peptidoglycan DD-metalloendopeptidase family protein [Ramlibacter agri]
MWSVHGRTWKFLCIGVACALLAACASSRHAPAPVEDRTTARHAPAPAAMATAEAPKVLPGAENAGKPGYYTVKPGDTLIRIALETGQNWRDIARWNGLDNPNVIEVGQVLRVAQPGTQVAAANNEAMSSRPLPPASGSSAPQPSASAARPATSAPAAAAAQPAASGEDEVAWGWPISGAGAVLAGFDEQKNKGLDIGGRAGEPVLAAADGRVVYAGAGLRGYGNLIILKHNNTYLTAYAHNQSLLVKEDQSVRKGQKIAEMGSTDTDRVKLHFEIRRQGKPVDPSRYLPPR